MNFFSVPVRVRYAETDQMGVVHHAVYPVWFEVARSELARARGIPYASWEERGYFLVVTALSCRFLRPARYDQQVLVQVRVKARGSRGVVFEYRVVNDSGELLAEGETHHVLLRRLTGKPAPFPADLAQALDRNGP